jgi:SAM-dependent methyltransferase
LPPVTLVEVDGSQRFVTRARNLVGSGVGFVLHDLAGGVIPVGDTDVMLVHPLLAHLGDLRAAVAGWSRVLAPGGVMLIDEVESIATTNALLQDYLGLAEHVVAHRGACMNACR